MLKSLHLIDPAPVRRYLLEKSQHAIAGGFSKLPGDPPDVYHAYLGLAALAIIDGSKDEDAMIGPAIENAPGRGNQHVSADVVPEVPEAHERTLREFDPTMCFSTQTRDWVESLVWPIEI